MSKLINKNTQFKAVRFPHIIIEGINKKTNESLSFSMWMKQAAKDKLLKDDNYNVDELMSDSMDFIKQSPPKFNEKNS